MAHKKAGGSVKNVGGAQPKYLGLKLADGERAQPGAVIARQRGNRIWPGRNVGIGKDHTLFALKEGMVKFRLKRKGHFDGASRKVRTVEVV